MRMLLVLTAATACLAGCNNVSKLDFGDLGREMWQRPNDVIAALELHLGDRVADIGAGEGYFVPYLIDAVGPNGQVFAVDVEHEITQQLEKTFAEHGKQLEVVLANYDDPLLPDGEIDLVLLVNTYHHIEARREYFERLQRDLSSTGRVAIVEPNADLEGVLSLFLDEGHVSRAADIRDEMRQAGYRLANSHEFLPVQIFEVFVPDD
jgi:ubiquinone/menaquinone biosynthesis C-methylase UbiE